MLSLWIFPSFFSFFYNSFRDLFFGTQEACQVERRFHGHESKCQPLHLVLGISSLSASSLRPSLALFLGIY